MQNPRYYVVSQGSNWIIFDEITGAEYPAGSSLDKAYALTARLNKTAGAVLDVENSSLLVSWWRQPPVVEIEGVVGDVQYRGGS